jgi:hypothetical protein
VNDDEYEQALLEVLDELRALRKELRQIRHGDELVARLTQAERQAIANEILDRLDERFARERQTTHDRPPTRAPQKRGLRRYLG